MDSSLCPVLSSSPSSPSAVLAATAVNPTTPHRFSLSDQITPSSSPSAPLPSISKTAQPRPNQCLIIDRHQLPGHHHYRRSQAGIPSRTDLSKPCRLVLSLSPPCRELISPAGVVSIADISHRYNNPGRDCPTALCPSLPLISRALARCGVAQLF
ncbi:hypothetical protein M0R45_020197 [Rubus argutus]|uniref:Uncharacterized protein n=1 Tax=Rubus argutus TaxID=59490 RepID=A0AAW1X9Z2_RUBAR